MSTEEKPKWYSAYDGHQYGLALDRPFDRRFMAGHDLSTYVNTLEARARWAEDVAWPALERIGTYAPGEPLPTICRAALRAYPQPEKETPA